jgi:hypothetical protein
MSALHGQHVSLVCPTDPPCLLPAIDLVDGEMLCDLLRQHRLGVRVEMVERVSVDAGALAAI